MDVLISDSIVTKMSSLHPREKTLVTTVFLENGLKRVLNVSKRVTMKNEIALKIFIIFLMISFVLTLALSAYWMRYNEQVALLHMGIGIVFLTILPLHIYLRREKLKKMSLDFYNMFVLEHSESSCKNNGLLRNLKLRKLSEVCKKLNLDRDATRTFLEQKNVIVADIEDTLEKISEDNAYDSLKIFAMIVENHMRTL